MNAFLKSLNERSLALIIGGVSIAVFVLVALLMSVPNLVTVDGVDFSMLPAFHALINGTCTILLIAGYVFIRRRQIAMHKLAMVSTFMLSTVFLLSYVTYHANVPSTSFGGTGAIRWVYFFILITHIILAAVILPLALYTIVRAWRGEFSKHKSIARITLPLWIYVTATGVVVYLMISPYYR